MYVVDIYIYIYSFYMWLLSQSPRVFQPLRSCVVVLCVCQCLRCCWREKKKKPTLLSFRKREKTVFFVDAHTIGHVCCYFRCRYDPVSLNYYTTTFLHVCFLWKIYVIYKRDRLLPSCITFCCVFSPHFIEEEENFIFFSAVSGENCCGKK